MEQTTATDPQLQPALDASWHPVARSWEVGDGVLRVVVEGETWALRRVADDAGEGIVAVRDRCPHRGAPLSAGTVEDGCFVCPYHGWRFDPSGACTEVPALGPDGRIPARARLAVAGGVLELDGQVWLQDATPEGAPVAPQAGEGDPAKGRPVALPRLLGNDEPGLRHAWHPVCRTDEVAPGATTSVELLGHAYALSRPDGGGPICAPAAADVAERLGHVWLSPEPPRTELLDVAEWDEPGWQRVSMDRVEGRYGLGLLVDNQLDAGHFAFVHRGTFGNAAEAVIDPYEVVRRGLGFDATLRVPITAGNDRSALAGERPLQQHRVMTYRYAAPAALWIRLDYEELGSTGIVFCFTALDAERTRIDVDLLFRHPRAPDVAFTDDALADRLAFEQRVIAEDLDLQARFDDIRLPLTATAEVHTRVDRSSVELRRVLLELLGE